MSEIKLNLPKELPDNFLIYLDNLYSVIEYSSPDSDVDIRKKGEEYSITITPSNNDFKQVLVKNLLDYHHSLAIKIIFSKSLAISKKVSFLVFF